MTFLITSIVDSGPEAPLLEWNSYVARKDGIVLDRAVFLLAKTLQDRSLDIDEEISRLDLMGRQLAERVGGRERPTEIIAAINEYIFEESGFRGNSDDYYDPRNSYLNHVLVRKMGIPITLSALYIELAKRIGFDLRGVGFPGHFLVKYSAGGLEIVIDPFNKGRILGSEDFQALLDQLYHGQVRFEPRFLAAATTEQILVRMLRNLKDAFLYSYDHERALLAIDMILAVNPELAEEFRDKGMLLYQRQRYAEAFSNLSRYLEMQPDAVDADNVMMIMRDIRSFAGSDMYK